MVRQRIEALGRMEDVRFSPSGARLALAGFGADRVLLLDIEVSRVDGTPEIVITGHCEIASPAIMRPHGIEFLGEDRLIVANREGESIILALPSRGSHGEVTLAPARVLASPTHRLLRTPSAVAVIPARNRAARVLICNNYSHTVEVHDLPTGTATAGGRSRVLLNKWLNIPDGIAASRDGRWLAVSSHDDHRVLLYDLTVRLGRSASPHGILRGLTWPHGLRFSADGHTLFVADAGTPDVVVYAAPGADWSGLKDPIDRIEVMDGPTFARGEGPKGIDTVEHANVLAVASVQRPLAFFTLRPGNGFANERRAGGNAAREQRQTPEADAGALQAELARLPPWAPPRWRGGRHPMRRRLVGIPGLRRLYRWVRRRGPDSIVN